MNIEAVDVELSIIIDDDQDRVTLRQEGNTIDMTKADALMMAKVLTDRCQVGKDASIPPLLVLSIPLDSQRDGELLLKVLQSVGAVPPDYVLMGYQARPEVEIITITPMPPGSECALLPESGPKMTAH